jgi:exonuclease SbcD
VRVEILSALDTHVVGGHEPARSGDLADPSGVLVPLRGAGGHVGLVVAAVPFLNDWRIGVRGFDVDAGEQLASMQDAFGAVYRRLADKAEAAFPGVPMLATGHLTCLGTAGARVGDEDAVPLEINRVGTLGAMGPGIFDPRFSYVALGHIHRGFAVDPAARVWYAGTPVQVSAVEGAEGRRVLLVDVDAGGVRVEKLAVPCARRLVPLAGTLDEVCEALGRLRVPSGELDPYVTVSATLARPDTRAEAAVMAAAAANTACRPVVVQVHARVARQGLGALDARPLFDDAVLTPEEAFTFAWHARYGSEAAPPDPVLQRLRELVARVDGGAR